MHRYVYYSTIHSSKDLELTQMPINDRLDKANVAYIHHGVLGKNEFISFAGTWMKLEIIILSKLTREQKTKHCMFFTCTPKPKMQFKKKRNKKCLRNS